MSRAPASPPRRRRVPLAAAFAALLALALAARWALPAALERALPIAARRAGVAPLALRVHSARWDRLELREVRAGPDDELRIGRVVIEYTLRGLLERRVDRIAAADLRVRGTLDQRGLSVGGLGRSGTGGAAPARPPALSLESARLELASPLGALEVDLDAELDGSALRAAVQLRSTDGRLRARLALEPAEGGGTGAEATVRAAGRLELELRDLTLPGRIEGLSAALEAAFSVELGASGLALHFEGCGPLRVSRAALPGGGALPGPLELCVGAGTALRADRDPTAAPGRRLAVASSVELREIRLPGLEPALALAGRLDSRDQRVGFRARLRDAAEALVLEVEGVHALGGGGGRARIRLLPIRFDPGGLQPGDLLAIEGQPLRSVSGALGLEGSLRWSPAGLEMPFEITAEQLSFELGGIAVEELDAEIQLDRLWPPRTPPRQRVRIARLDSGLALTDGELLFQIRPDGRLAIERLVWRAAGGRLSTRGMVDPGAERQELTWRVEAVDLLRLLEEFDLEGLSGTGTLAGELPVRIEGDGVQIRDGRLTAADPGGWIRYRSSAATDLPLAAPRGVDLARRVLENFRYRTLRARINGGATGDVDLQIHLIGANPDVYDGHPVELNFEVEGLPVGGLLRAFSVGTRFSHRIAERLARLPQPLAEKPEREEAR